MNNLPFPQVLGARGIHLFRGRGAEGDPSNWVDSKANCDEISDAGTLHPREFASGET